MCSMPSSPIIRTGGLQTSGESQGDNLAVSTFLLPVSSAILVFSAQAHHRLHPIPYFNSSVILNRYRYGKTDKKKISKALPSFVAAACHLTPSQQCRRLISITSKPSALSIPSSTPSPNCAYSVDVSRQTRETAVCRQR
jgi:hypothetical protein